MNERKKFLKLALETSDNEVYVKSYIRNINDTSIGLLQPTYTKLNLLSPIKGTTKYITSLDSTERFLIPVLECKNVSKSFCNNIDNIVLDIENDLRKNIVIYNPIKFNIIFHDINDTSGSCQQTFESDTHLASTFINAYYLLNSENSDKKCNYPQALAKQFLTDYQLDLKDFDFTITLSQNENFYITNNNEINTKPDGYDLKLILYHEIIHGLGIKSEAISYQEYLKTNSVNPKDYTYYTDNQSYLFIMTEPTIYDTFIRNDYISEKSLAEEMQPMVNKLPSLQQKMGEYEKANVINFTTLMNKEVEMNNTILNGAYRALNIVIQEGLYFKGNHYNIPLQVFVNEFQLGVSISHTAHHVNEIENTTEVGDNILLDWKIPSGKLITDTQPSTNELDNSTNSSFMGPKILDMLNTIGWQTLNSTDQPKYNVNESVNIFADISNDSYLFSSFSIPYICIIELCIFLIFLRH
ncbi:hypothetical protein BCR32DRAFT_294892 [Anaeromyces robustus]|uniref:Sequence orphan n=1 Tax=Anaeromyces robustus TaxID=1754192 RepID=A0A1Y1WYP8_9FUNG|nr:hypothetical protein BCR32DRAFT_294892 [Anaeromyces robustus]|eukprot:ORX78681.1 hypothetical protein BCR32DRAFT_294892 [Anaeromyces robustus]